MANPESLDTFGSFFVKNFRDKSLDNLQGLLDGHWKAGELQSLQEKLSSFSPNERTTVRELVETLLTHAMHDLLFAFQEYHDCDSGIEITVNDAHVAAMSDGLHGEIFGEDGWIVRFSKHPAEAEIARSRRAEKDIERIVREHDDPRE